MPVFKFQTSSTFLEHGDFWIPSPVFSGVELLSGDGTFIVPAPTLYAEGPGHGVFAIPIPGFTGQGDGILGGDFAVPCCVFDGEGIVEVYGGGEFLVHPPCFVGGEGGNGAFLIGVASFGGMGVADATGSCGFSLYPPAFFGEGFADAVGTGEFVVPVCDFFGEGSSGVFSGEGAFPIPATMFSGTITTPQSFDFGDETDAVLRYSSGRRLL